MRSGDGRREPERSERGGVKRGRLRPHAATTLIISMLMLSACGFHPLHSQSYQASHAVGLSSLAINVAGSSITTEAAAATTRSNVSRRYSELLKAEIIDQTNLDGAHGEKLFDLAISYSELESSQFVNPDGTASRGDLVYTSHYTVTRRLDAKPITSGTITRVSSYNTSPKADYASYVSIEDARKRGILELAQDYKLRLMALLSTLNDPNAAEPEPKIEPINPILQRDRANETLRPR